MSTKQFSTSFPPVGCKFCFIYHHSNTLPGCTVIPEVVSERNLITIVPLVATFTKPRIKAILPVVDAEVADDEAGRL